jgi:plasmid stabilization system protein ParE
MIYRVLIEPTARAGIRSAIVWIARERSATAATRWYNSLEKTILKLGKYPRRFPVAAENDKFPEEIRELLHGKKTMRYRIIFTIRDDAVHVLYVRHAARDEIEP